MVQYQETRSAESLYHLIYLLEDLILKMIWQERKACNPLQHIEMQELFQIGIVALIEAVLNFKIQSPDHAANAFPKYLRFRIKRRLREEAYEQSRFVCTGEQASDGEDPTQFYSRVMEENTRSYEMTQSIQDILDHLLKKGKITELEVKEFTLRHILGMSVEETCLITGVHPHWHINKMVKLRKLIRKALREDTLRSLGVWNGP